jgi:uncharacterized membrane protein
MHKQNVVLCEVSKTEVPADKAKQGFTVRPSILQLIKEVEPTFTSDSWISDEELKKYKVRYIETLFQNDKNRENEIQEMVKQAVANHDFMSINFIDTINNEDSESTLGQRMADKVAEFGGSWTFIFSFFTLMAIWMFGNVLLKIYQPDYAFDSYPFIFLNLVLSCVASIQAPIIMMSQNRSSEKDRKRALNDFKVNLKNELEIMFLREKIDHIINNQTPHIHETLELQNEMMDDIKKSIDVIGDKKRSSSR